MSQWDRRPGASNARADEESGTESRVLSKAEKQRQLRALAVMHERGLIPDDVYAARAAAIEAAPEEGG